MAYSPKMSNMTKVANRWKAYDRKLQEKALTGTQINTYDRDPDNHLLITNFAMSRPSRSLSCNENCFSSDKRYTVVSSSFYSICWYT